MLTDAARRLPHGRSTRRCPSRAGVSQGLVGSFWIGVFVVGSPSRSASAPPSTSRSTPPRAGFTRFIDVNIRNLAGVPSVVYGILGLAIFVKALGGLHRRRSR